MITSDPAASELVLNVAVPVASRAPVPSTVEACLNVTVWPTLEGFKLEEAVVVVVYLLTF